MVSREGVFEEYEEDEDYMDPHYLHMVTDLDMYGLEALPENTDLPIELYQVLSPTRMPSNKIGPNYSNGALVMMQDDSLASYDSAVLQDTGLVPSMLNEHGSEDSILTHLQSHPPRPPSRMNF